MTESYQDFRERRLLEEAQRIMGQLKDGIIEGVPIATVELDPLTCTAQELMPIQIASMVVAAYWLGNSTKSLLMLYPEEDRL